MSFLHLHIPKRCGNTFTHVRLNCNSSPHHTWHWSKIIQPPAKVWRLTFTVHPLWSRQVSSPFLYKYQPSSGLSSSLLMKTSCLRLKLVELNFFASFNPDDQRKTYVSNISKYTFKSSRLIFSLILSCYARNIVKNCPGRIYKQWKSDMYNSWQCFMHDNSELSCWIFYNGSQWRFHFALSFAMGHDLFFCNKYRIWE